MRGGKVLTVGIQYQDLRVKEQDRSWIGKVLRFKNRVKESGRKCSYELCLH